MNSGEDCGGVTKNPGGSLRGSELDTAIFTCAQERARTSTPLRALEPEACANANNSGISAGPEATRGHQEPLAGQNSGEVPQYSEKSDHVSKFSEKVLACQADESSGLPFLVDQRVDIAGSIYRVDFIGGATGREVILCPLKHPPEYLSMVDERVAKDKAQGASPEFQAWRRTTRTSGPIFVSVDWMTSRGARVVTGEGAGK